MLHLEKASFLFCDASLQHKCTDFKVSQLSSTCLKPAFALQANQRLLKAKLSQKIGRSQTTTFLDSAEKQLRKGEIKVSKSITGEFHYFSAFSCYSAHGV